MTGQTRPLTVERRAFITGLLAGSGLVAAGSAAALATSPGVDSRLAFDIRRDGASIGRHDVKFRRNGDDLEVEIAIDIAISLAFIPVFAYRHRNREVWRAGRLVSLDSQTDDDGRSYEVMARATAQGLRVLGSEGDLLAPPEILPTSYWNARTVQQRRLLDSQHGSLLDVEPEFLGEESLRPGAAARRYRLSGDLNLDLWYSPAGEWQKSFFEARGANVSYTRLVPDDNTGEPE